MLTLKQIQNIKKKGRYIAPATAGDPDLGPLSLLPGNWKSLPGRGWNMIALPFADGPFKYRLLLNQYNETLKFSLVDKGVPNRGLDLDGHGQDPDQIVVALDYEQSISQIRAADFPESGLAGGDSLAIHHEPGLFLHMTNHTANKLDIARLATIPHGDSVLALGKSDQVSGAPTIPVISGLPIGTTTDLNSSYLAPYKHFHDNLFEGLFDPVHPNALLTATNNSVNIVRTTLLDLDTTLEDAGIVNIPFIVKQANASEMKSTFWIQELNQEDVNGKPILRLQYSQTVMLDFFDRTDGKTGRIQWPHVSINTLEKTI